MRQLFLAACLLLPVSAQAATLDGHWAVDATTDVGDCQRAFEGEFVVAQGAILEAEGGAPAGYIEANNSAWARFTRNGHIARAQGKFAGASASGTWSSNTSYCGGHWRAHKLR